MAGRARRSSTGRSARRRAPVPWRGRPPTPFLAPRETWAGCADSSPPTSTWSSPAARRSPFRARLQHTSPVLLIGAGSCRGRSESRWSARSAARTYDIDCDPCAVRGCPARGGRPGLFSRSRCIGVRCGGNCLPADAGLLTWWRRRARRAPAGQGRGRPPAPESASCPRSRPAPAWSIRCFTQFLDPPRFRVRIRPTPDGLARPQGVPLKP